MYAHLVHGYEEDLEAIQRVKSQVKGTAADTSRYTHDEPRPLFQSVTSSGRSSTSKLTVVYA